MRYASLLVALLPLGAETLLRVESKSDSRSYTIDLERSGIKNDLQAVSGTGTVPDGRLPDWLLPRPEAWPKFSGRESTINFRVGVPVENVLAYYQKLLQSRGFAPGVATRSSVQGTTPTEWVIVNAKPLSEAAEVSVRYVPRSHNAISSLSLESLGYDDASGVLRLRDRTTGQEFDLPKAAIIRNDLTRPEPLQAQALVLQPQVPLKAQLQTPFKAQPPVQVQPPAQVQPPVQVQTPVQVQPPLQQQPQEPTYSFPAWFPIYPGAKMIKRVGPSGNRESSSLPSLNAKHDTSHPLSKVLEFYRKAIVSAGLTMTAETIEKNGKENRPSKADLVARNAAGTEIVQVGLSLFGESTSIYLEYWKAPETASGR